MRPNTKIHRETASQTAGPYVHIGLSPKAAGFDIYDTESGKDIAGPVATGERIRVEGTVWDGNGEAVKDVLLEVWQADARGVHVGEGDVEEGFRGWGRVVCDFESGKWSFDTVKPGPIGDQAPHLALWIVARGINIGLHTRMYFGDLVDANASDPVLNMIEDERARHSLIATCSHEDNQCTYRFDITLQGDHETVFFDI